MCLSDIRPLNSKEPLQFSNSIPIRSRARNSKDPNLWPHSAAECDRPGVMFWVWVQFARAHKSADKCGGNSNSGWLADWLWDCGNHGYWVTMLMHAVPASNPPCTWHLYAPHTQLPATGEQLQSKRGSEAAEGQREVGLGDLPLLATEFLQTLQCVSFVIENCRTRESAVSEIYGPTCNGFQPRPISTSPPRPLPFPPTCSWVAVWATVATRGQWLRLSPN